MVRMNALRRVAVALVAAALLCGAPAQAMGWGEAGPPALFERVLEWLAGWLAGGPEEPGQVMVYQQQGAGIDPDGQAAGGNGPTCQGDQGACIDPDG